MIVPVGAGAELGGVGTLASPWQEGAGAHGTRTRATQPSPPLQVRRPFRGEVTQYLPLKTSGGWSAYILCRAAHQKRASYIVGSTYLDYRVRVQAHPLLLSPGNQLAGLATKVDSLRQAIANGRYLDKLTRRMYPFSVCNTDTHGRNIEADRNIRVSAGCAIFRLYA